VTAKLPFKLNLWGSITLPGDSDDLLPLANLRHLSREKPDITFGVMPGRIAIL